MDSRNKAISRLAMRYIPSGQKYRDILPVCKYYNAYNSGFNSRERMAKRLFNQIISTYIDLLVDDMCLYGKKVVLRGTRSIYMVCMGVKEPWMTDDEYVDKVFIKGYVKNHYKNEFDDLHITPSNFVKSKISSGVKQGVKYIKNNSDARKLKILQG